MSLFRTTPSAHPYQTPVVLLCLLLAVGGGLFAAARRAGPGAAYPPADQQKYRAASPEVVDAADPFPGLPRREDLDVDALRPLAGDDNLPPEQAADAVRLAPAIYEIARWLAEKPADYLARDAFPRSEWHFNRLLREPERWRFKMCHIYGMVARVEPEDFPGMGHGLDRLWRVTLFDDTVNVNYTVLTPLIPEGVATPAPGERAATLAADGMFLAVYPFRTEAGWERTPLFVAARAYRAAEAATPRERLDEALPGEHPPAQVPERTAASLDQAFLDEHLFAPSYSEARRRLPPLADPVEMAHDLSGDQPAIAHAFAYVHGRDPAELAAARLPGTDYADIMGPDKMPAWLRGQPVTIRGRTVAVRTFRQARPDALGLDRFHAVTVRAGRLPSGDPEDWTVAVLNLPAGLRFDDPVTATGVILKRYPYPAHDARGRVWRWAPLIAARALEHTPPPPPATWPYVFIAALSLGTTIWLTVAIRRGNNEVDALRRAIKHRHRRGNTGGATGNSRVERETSSKAPTTTSSRQAVGRDPAVGGPQ